MDVHTSALLKQTEPQDDVQAVQVKTLARYNPPIPWDEENLDSSHNVASNTYYLFWGGRSINAV